MKKIILLFSTLLVVHFLHAQQLKYSVEGGINFSGAYAVEDGMVIKGGPCRGFNLAYQQQKQLLQKFLFNLPCSMFMEVLIEQE